MKKIVFECEFDEYAKQIEKYIIEKKSNEMYSKKAYMFNISTNKNIEKMIDIELMSSTDKIRIYVNVDTAIKFYEVIKFRQLDMKIDTYSLCKMISFNRIDIIKYFIENAEYDFQVLFLVAMRAKITARRIKIVIGTIKYIKSDHSILSKNRLRLKE